MTCKGHQESDDGPVPELRPLDLRLCFQLSLVSLTVEPYGGGLQAEWCIYPREKTSCFFSISRGASRRDGIGSWKCGNRLERKEAALPTLGLFSKYKMKLSSRQPFFFFTKIILRLFSRAEYMYSLCAHSTCGGLN